MTTLRLAILVLLFAPSVASAAEPSVAESRMLTIALETPPSPSHQAGRRQFRIAVDQLMDGRPTRLSMRVGDTYYKLSASTRPKGSIHVVDLEFECHGRNGGGSTLQKITVASAVRRGKLHRVAWLQAPSGRQLLQVRLD